MSVFQESYDRICNLKVYNTTEVKGLPTGDSLSSLPISSRQFSSKQKDGSPGFRIKFSIRKFSGPVPGPHPAVISIYNLGPDSRTLVSKVNNVIVLEAGYGTEAKTLFKGNISYGITRKEGPDYVTEIHAGSGLFAFQNSLTKQSFETPTPATAVLGVLTTNLKAAGINLGLSSGIPTQVYNKGVVLSGKTTDELQTLCQKNNLDWVIENDEVIIVPYGGFKPSIPIFISEDTGMVGIPEIRATASEAQPLISFKVLLNSEIGVFQLVYVNSKFINGQFTVLSAVHNGDSFGTEWYTECEAH